MTADQRIEAVADVIRTTALNPETVCCFQEAMCATPPCACARKLAAAALTALQSDGPTPEQFAEAIFCSGHSPTNSCEPKCSCVLIYANVLELISRE